MCIVLGIVLSRFGGSTTIIKKVMDTFVYMYKESFKEHMDTWSWTIIQNVHTCVHKYQRNHNKFIDRHVGPWRPYFWGISLFLVAILNIGGHFETAPNDILTPSQYGSPLPQAQVLFQV
jgi:hypothetical protein